MIIYWFSEIKWDYLRTRKQQLLSRFPKSDIIFFIEPISRLIKNKYTFQNNNPIYNITIPQLRSVSNPFIFYIINLKIIRKCISIVSTLWFLLIRILSRKKPDVLVTSNVYWIETINYLIKKYPNVKLIYDCNDDPLSFTTIPISTKEYFIKTISTAYKIVIPHKSYIKLVSKPYQNKIKIISNGVDYNAFQSKKKSLSLFEKISDPILIYVGAIAEWFDFNLIKSVSRELRDVQIFLIGPVGEKSKNNLNDLILEKNITHIPTVPHDEIIYYLHYADVCVIPFLRTELTSTILPNKIFEYSAAGKPCVMTNFNDYLNEYEKYLFISENLEDFISNIKTTIEFPPQKNQLKKFASKYEWEEISKIFQNYLMTVIDE